MICLAGVIGTRSWGWGACRLYLAGSTAGCTLGAHYAPRVQKSTHRGRESLCSSPKLLFTYIKLDVHGLGLVQKALVMVLAMCRVSTILDLKSLDSNCHCHYNDQTDIHRRSVLGTQAGDWCVCMMSLSVLTTGVAGQAGTKGPNWQKVRGER